MIVMIETAKGNHVSDGFVSAVKNNKFREISDIVSFSDRIAKTSRNINIPQTSDPSRDSVPYIHPALICT